MRAIAVLLALSVASHGAPASWLATVSPIMTPAERKAYLSMEPAAQESFRNDFWANKQISAEEYYRRLQYIDATFGSTKTGSGANTDPGRVYLALGPPNRITRIPSSRVFVPVEIWYYETVPAANLNTELRVIFYQKNALGLPKLYSPTLDTVRALLLPQSSAIGMFGPNDNITESQIRQNLTVGPVEDEVLSASVSVAAGITGTGNDELLSLVTSPEVLLRRVPQPDVKSRLILFRPKLDTFQTLSSFGGAQVDFRLETELRTEIEVQVNQGSMTVYQNRVHVNFASSKPVSYEHRLDLLPGSYTIIFTVDKQPFPYSLDVAPTPVADGIRRAMRQDLRSQQHVPFEFEGGQYQPDPDGDFALLPVTRAGTVSWVIRRGFEVVSKTTMQADRMAVWKIPITDLPPGTYKVEAAGPDGDFQTELSVTAKAKEPVTASRAVISFNANLAPALRYAAVGHQWLLRGKAAAARESLEASLRAGVTAPAEIELARADALGGNLDQARERVRKVLGVEPDNFEALSVLAYIEAKFQDYPVAAALYRRALAIQDSPALRQALADLPKSN